MAENNPSASKQQPSKKKPSEAGLLDEYKSCDDLSKHIDQMIWQLATLVFPIALAGLTFFGVSTTHTVDQFIILVVVGAGSISLLLTWYFLSNQWADYQKLTYFRMREIEAELDLWHYRYAYYISQPDSRQNEIIEKAKSDTEKLRYAHIENAFGKFRHFGYGRTRKIITAIFLLGWVALIIREIIQTF